MTEKDAAMEVIASLVCTVGDLSCEEHCPFFYNHKDHCNLRKYDVEDAIAVLRKHFDI